MDEPREFSAADWARLAADLEETARESVRLGIMTEKEAFAWLAQFRQVEVNQRPRAYLRHRYRNIDARLAAGQRSQAEAQAQRRAVIDEAHEHGLGDPPW